MSSWKGNSVKYSILSLMTRDMLDVPMSTIASETTFSAGGRVIEPYHSCVKNVTIKMLLSDAD